jgi:hypothetical protein
MINSITCACTGQTGKIVELNDSITLLIFIIIIPVGHPCGYNELHNFSRGDIDFPDLLSWYNE